MMKPTSFATLSGNKIIMPSGNNAYFAIEKHFLYACMSSYVDTIHFDEGWYLETYPDIKDAVDKGLFERAKDHYVRFGYFEHRIPYLIEVDDSWYQSTYRDIRQAITERRFESSQAHFIKLGYAEGRLPHANFVLRMASDKALAADVKSEPTSVEAKRASASAA
jgi:hypothetical protein